MPELPRLHFGVSELHTTDRPSLTAQSVLLMRALEADRPADERIVDDSYARLFLTGAARLARHPLALGRPLLDLAERNRLTGLTTYVLCRHRFIDDHLVAALDAGAEQVVILGAGYDSRAYRFADVLDGRPVFEVDLPPLSRQKARIVAENPDAFGHTSITRVEVDFRTQSLATQLAAAGFREGLPTVVVWEGVAPYLSAEAVHGTLDALAGLTGPGTMLALDLWDGGGSGPLAGARRFGAWTLSLVGEPVTFAVTPLDASRLLGDHGFEIADLAEADELTSRYATAGRVAAASIYVVATQR